MNPDEERIAQLRADTIGILERDALDDPDRAWRLRVAMANIRKMLRRIGEDESEEP